MKSGLKRLWKVVMEQVWARFMESGYIIYLYKYLGKYLWKYLMEALRSINGKWAGSDGGAGNNTT